MSFVRSRTRGFRPVLLLAGASVACVAACAPDGPDGGRRTGHTELAVLPRATLVEAFRLGGPAAPEPEIFTRVPPLAVAPDGSTLVLAASANEVRRFDLGGSFLGAIGGEGEGPGEFENAAHMGLVFDTVWVRNLSPPFVSFFSIDGELLGTERYPDATISRTGVPEGPEAMLSGGSYFTVGVVPFGGPRGRVEVPLLVVRPDGGGRDTLATVLNPASVSIPGVGRVRGIRSDPLPPLYDVMPGGRGILVAEWTAGDGRDASATPEEGEVRIHRFAPDGRRVRSDSVRFAAVLLTPAMADSIVEAAADSARALVARLRAAGIPNPPEVPPDLTALLRAELDLGEAFAPVRGLLAGVDGTTLLEVVTGPSDAEWVVLDADAEPLFRVGVPEGETLRAASTERVWTTRIDPLGVPYVIRYDVEVGG